MSDKIKYVVLPMPMMFGDTVMVPFLFPDIVTHADFASQMGFSMESVHSAGFAYFDGKSWIAYGKSVSIGKGTADDTQKLFDRYFP
jgi:hypothetical protein